MKRAIGYCERNACTAYLKGVFLLNHGDRFYCPQCREQGFIEKETHTDWSWRDGSEVYKTVRVHFNFNPASRSYMEIAIVDIPELPTGSMAEIHSPLIKTEKRALKVAEAALCALNSGIKDGGHNEIVLDMDKPNYPAQLAKLEELLNERERRVSNALRR